MKLKKLVAFLIAATMLISIAPFVYAEETNPLTEVESYSVAVPKDADFWALSGDDLNTETWMGGPEVASIIRDGSPIYIYYEEDTTVTINNVDYTAKKGMLDRYKLVGSNSIHGQIMTTNIELENRLKTVSGIDYSIPVETYSGGVNDSLVRYSKSNDVYIPTSGKPSSKISFAYTTAAKSNIPVTLHYADGTSSDVTLSFVATGTDKNTIRINGYGAGCMTAEGKAAEVNEPYTFTQAVKKSPDYYSDLVATEATIADGSAPKKSYASGNYAIASIGTDVASGKLLEGITLGAASSITAIWAVTETALTNAELSTIVADVDLTDKDAVSYAKACADELVLRGANASDYQAIFDAYEDFEYKLSGDVPEFIYADISSQFDADMIAKVGDTPGSNWVGGLEECTRFAAINGEHITLNNGTLSISSYRDYSKAEIMYDESGAITGYKSYDDTIQLATSQPKYEDVTAKVSFKFDAATFSGNVNDAVDLDTTKSFELSGRPLSQLWFAFGVSRPGYTITNITVEYTDGTVGTLQIAPTNTTSTFSYDNGASYVPKWITNDMVMIERYSKDWTVKKDEVTGFVAANASTSTIMSGFTFVGKNIENKGIKRITIPARSETLLVAITEVPVATETLTAYVDNVVSTTDYIGKLNQAAQIKTANEYVDELLTRHVYRTTDEEYTAIKNLYQQSAVNEYVYIDISASGLDADVIVPNNSTILKSEYNGRNDAETANDHVYDAALMPYSGIITMNPPTNQTIPNYPAIVPGYDGKVLTDATFKLSGNYKDFGNDALLVRTDDTDGVTVEFSTAEQRRYKDMYFLLDAPKGEASLTWAVNIKINFTDGTSLDATTRLHSNHSYYNPYTYAHKSFNVAPLKFTESIDDKDNIILTTENGTGDNVNFFASGLNTKAEKDEEGNVTYTDHELAYKDVASVTFMPNTSKNVNYTILAVTAVPYENDELNAFWEAANDDWTSHDSYWDTGLGVVVVGENDELLEKGAQAAIEIYEERDIKLDSLIDEYEYADALKILEAVDKARQLDDKGFESKLKIDVANGTVKATATITNLDVIDKEVVLVVAVYGANDKLLNLQVSQPTEFKVGAVNEELPVSCDDVEGAVAYRAFIWESLESMRPIAATSLEK